MECERRSPLKGNAFGGQAPDPALLATASCRAGTPSDNYICSNGSKRSDAGHAARERILTEKDPVRLERWLERAILTASVAEVIDEPS